MALTPQQQHIVNTLLTVGRQATRGLPQHERDVLLKAALETGSVESNFSNPAGGDGTSVGWRQETASSYPGVNRMDVVGSANRFYREALQAYRPGIRSGDLAAAVQRPAAQYRGRYAQASGLAQQLLGGAGGGSSTGAPSLPGVMSSSSTQFDQAGFEKAQQKLALAEQLARRSPFDTGNTGQPANPLFSTGVLGFKEPNPQDFTRKVITQRLQPSPSTPGAVSVSAPGGVKIASGADRAGADLRHPLLNTLGLIAGALGQSVTVGTGTNHNQYVEGEPGVQSWHWTGQAADLPATGSKGDRIAAAAIEVLGGVPASQAMQMARKGGVFNFTYHGKPAQVLWKTMVGGNHFNHVHVGLKA